MPNLETPPTPSRRAGTPALAALAALTAVTALAGCRSDLAAPTAESAPSTAAPPSSAPRTLRALHRPAPGGPEDAVPSGGGVLDEQEATVANLDPALLAALRRAATSAAADGVELRVTSGWRSAAHQQELLQDAVAEYGSEEEAARWVATPQTSAHVSGDAVDIGPTGAATWLAEHGTAYDLCQIYRNEPWHFELRAGAGDHGCPAMYADPTEDPRMQQ